MSLESELSEASAVKLGSSAKTVDMVVRSSLDSAYQSFAERPSAQNWSTLQGCMYAWQFWAGRSPKGKERLAEELWPVGIGHWVGKLAAKVGKHTADD